jgi:hypothetical protein
LNKILEQENSSGKNLGKVGYEEMEKENVLEKNRNGVTS